MDIEESFRPGQSLAYSGLEKMQLVTPSVIRQCRGIQVGVCACLCCRRLLTVQVSTAEETP